MTDTLQRLLISALWLAAFLIAAYIHWKRGGDEDLW